MEPATGANGKSYHNLNAHDALNVLTSRTTPLFSGFTRLWGEVAVRSIMPFPEDLAARQLPFF